MKKDLICLLLIFFVGITFPAKAQIKAYPIDSWHSDISFSVKFGDLLPIRGRFDKFSGTILLDEQDLLKTSVTLLIDASSINTGVEMRDTHLKSSDFFDVEKYSKLIFSSKKVFKQGEQFVMEGDLNMHGISKEVKIPFVLVHGEQADPWKNFRITLQAAGEINRLDFGIGEGRNTIGETVEVQLILSGRIFNTETISLFQSPFGQRMVHALENGGIETGREELSKLNSENDKDANDFSNFNFIHLKLKQNGNLMASLQAAKLSVEVFPEDAKARSLLGYSYYENGEIKKALMAFKKALILDEKETLAIEMLKWLEKK